MTALPIVADLADPATTEAAFQAAIAALRDAVGEIPGGNVPDSLTIASGSVVPVSGSFIVDGPSGSNNLTNIVPASIAAWDGHFVFLRIATAARTVTLKNMAGGTGQIKLANGGDYLMGATNKWMTLRYNSSAGYWEEVATRSMLMNQQSTKTATFSITPSDIGTTFLCSGTFAITPNAAATLGPDFYCTIKNSGTGTITLTPNGTNLLNGVNASITLTPGSSFELICDGTALTTLYAANLADVATVRTGTDSTTAVTPSSLSSLWKKGSDIASATTLVKPSSANLGGYHFLTGTNPVSALWSGEADGAEIELRVTGNIQFVNSSTLVMLGGGNINCVFGDILRFRYEATGTIWRHIGGQKFDGTAWSGNVTGLKNLIINGNMDMTQRGQTFAAIGTNAYSLDRWIHVSNTGAVATVSYQTDVPSSNEFQSSLRFAVTTADTSIAAGEVQYVAQFIEGLNCRHLVGQPFTLSFWARSSKTGVHCVSFRNSGFDRSYVAEYTINVANTWEKKTITVPAGLITAGTWDWGQGAGLRVNFALAVGSSSQTTAGAWQTGNFIGTANQVNCLDTAGNIFAITGVQLELGSQATAFEHLSFALQLMLCQRYYEKNFPTYVNPVQGYGQPYTIVQQGVGASTTQPYLGSILLRVEKRANPTLTCFNPNSANSQARNTVTGTDCSGTTLTALGPSSFLIAVTTPAGSSAGQGIAFNWTAEAEL
jgi:hypothetical protein